MPWNIRHPYQCLIPIDDRDIFTIVQLPLAFVRSGFVVLNNGRVGAIGENSYDQSRVAQATIYTYILYAASISMSSSGYDARWHGFPLRCLSGMCKIKPTDHSAGLCR